MSEKKYPFQILNGNALKMIAIVTMLIDHTAVVLIENGILRGPFQFDFNAIRASQYLTMWWNADRVMRAVGRLAFPIFCYLIVEGFLHTRDVKKYAGRLLAFGFLSEIPFDLAIFGTWFYRSYQNVYFTLLLGLLAIAGIRKFQEEGGLWEQALTALLCCSCAQLLKTDYGAFGVFFIIMLYLTRSQIGMQTGLGIIALLSEAPTAPLAFVPIRMYNKTRGKRNLKWFFYVFYPAHLLILAVIGKIIF